MKIDSFKGKYSFLSNFYPCMITVEGQLYSSVEHAYQAMKTLDLEARKRIARVVSAGDAKRMGKVLKLRNDWEEIKVDVMLDLVAQKFQQEDLAERLIETGDAELVEGNWWKDTFWGVCNGEGKNMLGQILMTVREGLNEHNRIRS